MLGVCIFIPMKTKIENGYKINMLTVIKELSPKIRPNGHNRRVLLCECECGKTKEILYDSIRSGRTNSCGCYHKKVMSIGQFAKKHGLSNSPIFTVWKRMLDRCYDKKHTSYKNYGGRGIFVCDQWKKNPLAFVEWAVNNGWLKGLQIDRINNDGHYDPNNCRFVTREINALNKRPYKKRNNG